MAQETLARAGIKSFVSADDAGGMEPQLQMSMGVRLIVARADAEGALAALATLSE